MLTSRLRPTDLSEEQIRAIENGEYVPDSVDVPTASGRRPPNLSAAEVRSLNEGTVTDQLLRKLFEEHAE